LSNINYSLDFELSDNNYIPNLFGVDDKNIHIIEKVNNVQIKYRGNKIKIIGAKSSIKNTKEEILLLFEEVKKGIDIDEDKIMESRSMKILEINPQDQMDLFFQTKKRKISPRTQNQKDYFQLLNSKDIVFAYGPAGTGKTFLAVAKAVASLQQGLVKKIVLSRPAVEAGEKLGFLPGDLKEKVDPFLRPIYDALYEMMPYDQVEKKLANNIIEIAPIAFMRGRTLEDCFIILDEAQNTTKIQMKMFLTRLGKNSKMVLVGDNTQIDLISKNDSGLIDASKKLKNIQDIGFIELDQRDVIRHEVVRKIINAYEQKNSN
jgi:phosphate starvation-inducible protein PhoH and related proteins